MDIMEYQQKRSELQGKIDNYEDQIDELNNAQRALRMEQYQLDQKYHAERMANLKLENGNVVVGFAKYKDYHFMMIQAFVIVNSETAFHIDTINHNYACNDFYYSFGSGDKNIKMEEIIEMFEDFHVYVFEKKVYDEMLMKMAMLEINIDNFDSFAATYTAQAIKKISE